MGPFGVVVDEPGVEVILQGLDAVVEGLAHLHPEELVQHRTVEAFDEAIGARRADPGLAMLDAGQGEVEFKRVCVSTAELAAVVGEDGADLEPDALVERQHVVVHHSDRRLGLLGDMQEAEGVGAEGVDDGMEIDLADALQVADEQCVLTQQFAGHGTLDVALAKRRIELLDEGDLLGGELDRGLGIAGLQRQPAVVTRAEIVVVEDLLDGDRRHPLALQHQHRLDAIAAIGRVIKRQGEDALAHLDRRRLRVRLVDRRQVFQAGETFELEPALPLVEARPIHAATATGLRCVTQLLG